MPNPLPALMHGIAGGAAFVLVTAAMFGPAVLDTLNGRPSTAAAAPIYVAPPVAFTPEPTIDGNWSTETVTLPSAPTASTTRRTTTTSVPGSAEATVRIPSVGINRAVRAGAQGTIDQNQVAHYTGWPSTFVDAGRPGVYWLAAHNSRNGGPFTSLPRIKKGADIVVTTRTGNRYTYRVTGTAVVLPRVQRSVVWGVYGPNDGPPRAVLQTCVGKKRLLVYASLV